MIKMSMKSGGKEEILDLVDVPEFVLMQACDVIVRKQNLRDPDTMSLFRELTNALRAKLENGLDSVTVRGNITDFLIQADELIADLTKE